MPVYLMDLLSFHYYGKPEALSGELKNLRKKVQKPLILEEFGLSSYKGFWDPFGNTEAVASATFNYDFEAIRDVDYEVDPNTFPPSTTPIEFQFYHDEAQRTHIANQVMVYANHPVGLGKMIQNSNLQLVFRNFAALP